MRIFFWAIVAMFAPPLFAQIDLRPAPVPQNAPHATVLRDTPIYLEGDEHSEKLATIATGREIVILSGAGGDKGHWLRVYANIDEEMVHTQDQPMLSEHARVQPISGWMQDQNVVTANAKDGSAVLFGEAISLEQAASSPHPPPDAALDGRRLYRMTVVLFPQGARAGEAMWRSADIRWQLQKQDAATLPSAHEKENYLRQMPDEDEMLLVERSFPGTKWASFAAYDLIDNKLCGDWQGSEKCPEQESTYYNAYAAKYPDSPRAPEALYLAAWRLACAGDMWEADKDEKRSTNDRNGAVDTATHLLAAYPTSDYAARGASLIYKVQHAIPIYGSDRE